MEINIREIKALSALASTDQTRSHLNGVFVQSADGRITYTATDNEVAGQFKRSNSPSDQCSILIPIKVLKGIKLSKSDSGIASLVCVADGLWRIVSDKLEIEFYPPVNIFPLDQLTGLLWSKAKANNCTANFSFQNLVKFLTMGKALLLKYPGDFNIDYNGHQTTLINRFDLPGFSGLIMPKTIS